MFDRQGSITQDNIRRYSVSELNFAIRDLLEQSFFYCIVEGEVSNIAAPPSGHLYLTLKDNRGTLRAILWRSQAEQYRHLVQYGAKLTLKGKVSAYPARGEYQFIASHVEPQGQGDLFARFEALKKKLLLEGLFDQARKQEIPKNPQKIGIITSENAAALQDVLNVMANHRPDIPLLLYRTLVQGERAKEEIVAAIEQANREQQCDLLLLIRGGGSIEDLWPFNEESVARAIAASSIPIISGVGHETDTTIADFVADLRAATPSVAAKSSAISRDYLLQYLDHQEARLIGSLSEKLQFLTSQYQQLAAQLNQVNPLRRLALQKENLSKMQLSLEHGMHRRYAQIKGEAVEVMHRLNRGLLESKITSLRNDLERRESHLIQGGQQRLAKEQMQFGALLHKLEALSPLKVLARGYGALSQSGDSVAKVADLEATKPLMIRLIDGELTADIVEVKTFDERD